MRRLDQTPIRMMNPVIQRKRKKQLMRKSYLDGRSGQSFSSCLIGKYVSNLKIYQFFLIVQSPPSFDTIICVCFV